MVYLIVCFLAVAGVGKEEWMKYDNKNNGRHNLQMNLELAGIAFNGKVPQMHNLNARGRWHVFPMNVCKVFLCMTRFTNG